MKSPIVWFIVAGAVLSACDQKRHPDQPVVTPAAEGGKSRAGISGSGGSPSDVQQGTVDGGGGAGLNGKPIESYRIDPTTLPEYASQIQPILDDVKRVISGQNVFGTVVNFVTHSRSWYLVPVDLAKIPAAKMGLPFTNDQWAVQTSTAVWLGEKYAGDEELKGVMLLHEILMGIKILRHASDFDQCMAMYDHNDICERSNRDPIYETPRVRDIDHEQVRTVAAWLVRNHAKMTAREFADVLFNNKFFGKGLNFYHALPDPNEAERRTRKLADRTEDFIEAAKSYKFYTDYDDVTHLAKSTCDLNIVLSPDHETQTFTFKVTDRATGHVKANRTVTMHKKLESLYWWDDHYVPTDIWAGAYTSMNDEKPPYIVGNTYNDLMFEFGFGQLRALRTNIMVIKTVMKEKDFEHIGQSQGRRGDAISCEESEMRFPISYGSWTGLPKEDREELERRYIGDTFENIYRSRKYDIKLP